MKHKGMVDDRLIKYSTTPDKVMFQDLNISKNGYKKEQVAEQRKKYGSNFSAKRNRDTVLYCIRKAFVNPFSTILFCLGVISFITDVLLSDAYQKKLTTVLIIFSMLIISGVVRLTQELHSKHITDELLQLVHTDVRVLRNGEWIEIFSEDLVVGDQVKLVAGDRVPADMRLIESVDLFTSQSVITGESAIFEKSAEKLTEVPHKISEFKNVLFGGTTIVGGSGTGVVLAVGQDTVYGGLKKPDRESRRGFDKGANSIAMVLIKFMVILLPVVYISCGLTKGDWMEALLFAISVAIGLTPELLPMVVTACLAKGSHSMGQKQTIVKNINAMQGFGSMDVLCVDKTGTLTGDKLLLEYYMDILGNENQKVLDYAFLGSIYHTGVTNHLDASIGKAADMPGHEKHFEQLMQFYSKLDEIPFDYERCYTSVLINNKTDKKNICIIKGSIDHVIEHCSYMEYRGNVQPVGSDVFKNVHEIVDEMLEDGMKVIAVAYKNMDKDMLDKEDEKDFILLGYLAFFDAPKRSVADAIEKLHNLNVKCKVLSGDQKQVVLSICRRIGINTEYCLTGAELDAMSENELPVMLEKTDVFVELSPKQKAMIVENLQINGHSVGFLGDGMNDLPAILQADVGISVENATEAVQESSDVILLKKDLNVLEEGILEGRKAFMNMSKYIKITASSNFGNICSVVVAGILLPFFPMTSVQLLLLNLLYDIICLVLPWDNVDEEMIERPLEWSGKKLGKFMMYFGPISSFFDIITYLFLYFILCPMICGGSYSALGDESQKLFIALFQTGWFLESMWTQVLILQLLRTKQIPFIQSSPSKSVVGVAIIGIILLSLLPFTLLGRILGLTRLPLVYFMYLVVSVMMYLIFVTIAKLIYIRKNRKLI